MKCSDCGSELEKVSHLIDESCAVNEKYIIFRCPKCQTVSHFSVTDEEAISQKQTKKKEYPPLEVGANVYIANKQHRLHLEFGVIEQRDHKYYRIKLISTDKELNGNLVWLPEHWVKELPEDMCKK